MSRESLSWLKNRLEWFLSEDAFDSSGRKRWEWTLDRLIDSSSWKFFGEYCFDRVLFETSSGDLLLYELEAGLLLLLYRFEPGLSP